MLASLTSSELTEWMAEDALSPFGPVVEDLRAGLAAAATINANRKEDAAPVGPLDFYPWHNPALVPKPAQVETPEQLARRIKIEVFRMKPEDV